MLACVTKQFDILKTLVLKGMESICNINFAKSNKEGNDLFKCTLLAGAYDISKLLLEHDEAIYIFSKNNAGLTARDIAQQHDQKEIFEILTKEEANNKLIYATCRGSLKEIVQELIRGADIDVQTRPNNCFTLQGQTPLFLATERNNSAIVDYLVKIGANLDAQDAKGDTPLHKATKNGHLLLVQRLIKAGTSLTLRDDSEYSFIDLCTKMGFGNQTRSFMENLANFFTAEDKLAMFINHNDREFDEQFHPYALRYLINNGSDHLPELLKIYAFFVAHNKKDILENIFNSYGCNGSGDLTLKKYQRYIAYCCFFGKRTQITRLENGKLDYKQTSYVKKLEPVAQFLRHGWCSKNILDSIQKEDRNSSHYKDIIEAITDTTMHTNLIGHKNAFDIHFTYNKNPEWHKIF